MIFTDLQKVLIYHLYLQRSRMKNTGPTHKCAISQLSLTMKFENLHYNVEIGNNSKGLFCLCQHMKETVTLNSSLSGFQP